ncbi:MAG: hypothetical protein GY715_05005 [Planctomycetes bacterium]|nr:hypothetical protein [Planctomycetota bacterium]
MIGATATDADADADADTIAPGAPVTGQAADDEVRFLATILRSDSSAPETRIGAATRLLRLQSPAAYAVIDDVLRTGDGPNLLAVVTAMSSAPLAEPALLDATVSALDTAGPEARDLLGIALSKYEQPALERLLAIVRDPQLPSRRRLGAIHALGSFPRRESGDELIALADPRHGENDVVRAAALESLRRLAPADLGDDFQAWRAWWFEVRDKSPEEWARELVRQYQQRAAALQQANRELADRYIEALDELHKNLPVSPDQLERLPRLLNDAMPRVRRFAMERIARLLRDSVLIPDTVRRELLRCLADDVPQVRLMALRLLHELDEPEVGRMIVDRLSTERDRAVLAGIMEVLENQPLPAALAPVLGWLDDAQLGTAAAEATWAILDRPRGNGETAVGAATSEQIRKVTRDAALRLPSLSANPALARLLARVGAEEDLPFVEPLLDDPDANLRRAVAEGLRARGLEEPLLARADDEAIYPSAVGVLADGPPELARFERLVAMRRAEGNGTERWSEAVRTLASRLDASMLLAADDMLAKVENGHTNLRVFVLVRAGLDRDTMPPEIRGAILGRVTPLLIEQNNALRAFELIEHFEGAAVNPGLPAAKFQAALLAGRYDAAERIHPEPAAWIVLLGELDESDRVVAIRLHEEIKRRFADRLDGTAGDALRAATRNLPAAPAKDGRTEADDRAPTP